MKAIKNAAKLFFKQIGKPLFIYFANLKFEKTCIVKGNGSNNFVG